MIFIIREIYRFKGLGCYRHHPRKHGRIDGPIIPQVRILSDQQHVEYEVVIARLYLAWDLGAREIQVKMESQLVVS